ncbi:MAG: hypothetical protein ACOZCL_18470, partial [Bacillota bacterium]
INAIDNLDIYTPEIIALNNIAIAYREGYHIIIASLEVLELLNKLEILDKSSRSIYNNLLSKFTFLESYEQCFTCCIIISSNECRFERNENNSKIVYQVPLVYFQNLSVLHPCILLAEDISDCEFYFKMGIKFLKEMNHYMNVKLQFDWCNGGGYNSYKWLKYHVESERVVLSIADNDKSYPEDRIGETLHELKKVFLANKNSSIIDLYELEVREKENLISPSIYMLCSNITSKDTIDKLAKIELHDKHQEKLRYLDIKDGIIAKKLKNCSQLKSYYSELFTDISDLISCTIEEIDLQDDDTILMNGIGNSLNAFVKDVLDDGLESKLLEVKNRPNISKEYIENIESKIKTKSNLVSFIPSYIKSDWESLCKKIISWGCCHEIIAI